MSSQNRLPDQPSPSEPANIVDPGDRSRVVSIAERAMATAREGGADRVVALRAPLSRPSDGGTVLVRMLRRQVEQERLRAQDALTLAITLKKQNLELQRQLEVSESRTMHLERQLERHRRSAKKVSFDSRIDALAARLVGQKDT